MDGIPEIRQWKSVNQACDLNIPVASDSDQKSTAEEVSHLASKHRSLILEAASRLAATRLADTSPKKPSLKRGILAESFAVNKRTRPNSNSKVKSASNETKMVSDKQVRTQRRVSEPVKRYLLPTKAAKINEMVMSSTGRPRLYKNNQEHLTKGKQTSEINESFSGWDKGCDSENRSHRHSLGLMSAQGSNILSHNSEISNNDVGAVAIERIKADVEMDWEIDDTFFDGSDFDTDNDLTLEHSEANTVAECGGGVSNLEQSTKTAGGRNSLLPGTVNLKNPSQSTSSVEAFLRRTYFEPVPTTKYASIPRLLPSLRIVTCFRIADALRMLKACPDNNPTGPKMTIELYAALIDHSIDPDGTQTFRFADLFFPSRPPYLIGTGRGLGQLINGLLSPKQQNSASEPSSSDSVICRAIVKQPDARHHSQRTNRVVSASRSSPLSANRLQHFHIEAIRESDWEEVQHVRGIVDPEGAEMGKKDSHTTSVDLVGAM